MPFPNSSFVREGKYELLHQRPVGRGGLGHIYHAREVALDREVAVKEAVQGFGTARRQLAVEKLAHEANIQGALHHPNIVAEYTFETDPDTGESYLICDFVAGGSLTSYLGDDLLPEHEAIALTLDLLNGLGYIHSKGIVHRDIKPSNILIRVDTEGQTTALLTDFGIARRLRDAPSTLDTGDMPSLTPEYCAPEQRIAGLLPDPRSDLYAVGLVLGEMLSDRRPYKASLQRLAQETQNKSPRHRRVAPHTSRALARVIDRATENDPARRYQDAAAFSAALRPLLRQHVFHDMGRVATPFWSQPAVALATLSLVLLIMMSSLVSGAIWSSAQRTSADQVAPTGVVLLQPTRWLSVHVPTSTAAANQVLFATTPLPTTTASQSPKPVIHAANKSESTNRLNATSAPAPLSHSSVTTPMPTLAPTQTPQHEQNPRTSLPSPAPPKTAVIPF